MPASRLSPVAWPQRLAQAQRLAAPCQLCELRCAVNRPAGERGRCGLADTVHVYSHMLHFGEETHLIPSYVINFAGCSMHCTFCSEDPHLRPPFAAPAITPQQLVAQLVAILPDMRPRPRNINLVGGEPSISLPFLLEFAFLLGRAWPQHPPLLLNTNGYLTPEALALCEGVFEIFVVDFKFGDDACAWSIGKVPYYTHVLTARLRAMATMTRSPDLVVRHLLMPGHLECCTRPVLDWVATHLPHAILNVMPGFVPFAGTRAAKHWTSLPPHERDTALAWLQDLNHPQRLWDGTPLP